MAYIPPWLLTSDPLAGAGPRLRLPNPQQLQQEPMPTPPSRPRGPNLLQRLAGGLFPSGEYEGLLDPGQLQGLKRQGLLQLGMGLLANSGQRVIGTPGAGTGERIAGAFQGVNFPQMMQGALQQSVALKGLAARQQAEVKRREILTQFQPQPNETSSQTEQRLRGMAVAFQSAGLADDAKEAGALLGQLRPADLGESGGTLYNKSTGDVVGHLPQAATDALTPAQRIGYAMDRLRPWEQLRTAVGQYQQFKALPPSEYSDAALQQAARALTNVAGYPSGSADLGKLPVVGQLARMLQALSGQQKLSPEQRSDLVRTTDQVVARLSREAQRERTDVEDRLRRGPHGLNRQEIQTYLPTWAEFAPRGGLANDLP